jgi:hypothetical protein
VAATETLLQGATEIIRHVNASYTAGAGTLVIDSAVTDHGGSAVAVPYEILVGRNRPPSERRFFVVTAGAGTSLTIAASPGYADDQNYVAGDQVDLISAWETQRRLRAFATLHTHTSGVDGAALVLASLPTIPMVRVRHNANQSLADSTLTVLAFNTETFDTDTMHDTVTNNSRITINTAGRYFVFGSVQFAPNATGYRRVDIWLNGVLTGTALVVWLGANAGGVASTVGMAFTLYTFAVNDYIELAAVQASGGALNAETSGVYGPSFGAYRVGA